MKFIKLLTSAYVSGVLRHPHEGVLHIENDDEAKRLVDEKVGEDVTGDFTAKENKETPAESITAGDELPREPLPSEPHQSEVAPQATEEPAKPARKGAASKE